jgi:UDP-glucose 4-epimerase
MTPNNISKHIAVIGAGFLGKPLIRKLIEAGHVLHVLDRNDCPDEFTHKLNWVKGNYHDHVALSSVLTDSEIAYHLISSTVPGDQHIDVAREVHENVLGALNFIKACTVLGVKRVVYASSASVYGVQDHFPVAESASTWPISAHGIHKLAVEKFFWLAHHERKLDVRILRIANPYGPGQSIKGRQGFVAIAIGCLLRGETLILRNNGNIIRDFIYVEDVATSLVATGIIESLPLILNIGAGQGCSLRQIAELIENLSGRSIKVENAPSQSIDIPVSVLNNELAKESLGFLPEIKLRDGLEMTLSANGV